MKRAKQIKPRKAVVVLLKKGGVHQRRDKRASRARQKRLVTKALAED